MGARFRWTSIWIVAVLGCAASSDQVPKDASGDAPYDASLDASTQRDAAQADASAPTCPESAPSDGFDCYLHYAPGDDCRYGDTRCTCTNLGQNSAVWRCTQGVADASTSDGATDDASSTGDAGLSCTPFPSFRRDCETSTDCALAFRTYNCCGSQLVTGVRADQLDAFNRAATYCDSLFPACGCATQGTLADDGTVDTYTDSAAPSVVCQDHQCWSSFTTFSGKTPCGYQGATCDAATEICRTTSGAGPALTSECVALPQACATRRTCDCLGADLCTGISSECSEDTFANAIQCTCSLCQ